MQYALMLFCLNHQHWDSKNALIHCVEGILLELGLMVPNELKKLCRLVTPPLAGNRRYQLTRSCGCQRGHVPKLSSVHQAMSPAIRVLLTDERKTTCSALLSDKMDSLPRRQLTRSNFFKTFYRYQNRIDTNTIFVSVETNFTINLLSAEYFRQRITFSSFDYQHTLFIQYVQTRSHIEEGTV